ncbi:MAG: hypothetical protein AAF959_11365 [Cyanobacteria bacterium P01_D01_bin.56]
MEYKRGEHPNSKANLGKPVTKGGKKNLTLTQDSLDWLAEQKNASATVDELILEAAKTKPVLDRSWLSQHGTIFALTYWENEYLLLLGALRKIQEQQLRIEKILDESNQDEDLELENLCGWGIGLIHQSKEKKAQAIEKIIFEIKATDWVESPEKSLEILFAMGLTPKKITQEQFENEWQKTEAGY